MPRQGSLRRQAAAPRDPQLLSSVTDILFFPSRVAAGLATKSLDRSQPIVLPQNLQQLGEAAAVWAQRGKVIEAQGLDTISALLPEQAQGLLQPFRSDASSFAVGKESMPIDVSPFAPSTTSASTSAGNPSNFASNQLAAELTGVKGAVFLVNQTAQALLSSSSTAEEPMLRLNLQDARNSLQKRMEELSDSSSSGVSAEAVDEAILLLAELEIVL